MLLFLGALLFCTSCCFSTNWDSLPRCINAFLDQSMCLLCRSAHVARYGSVACVTYLFYPVLRTFLLRGGALLYASVVVFTAAALYTMRLSYHIAACLCKRSCVPEPTFANYCLAFSIDVRPFTNKSMLCFCKIW